MWDQIEHNILFITSLFEFRGEVHICVASVDAIFRLLLLNLNLGVRYMCDQCEHSSSSPSSLRKHKRSKHDGIRFVTKMKQFNIGGVFLR